MKALTNVEFENNMNTRQEKRDIKQQSDLQTVRKMDKPAQRLVTIPLRATCP